MHFYIAIFLGGCLGSIGRYSISLWVENLHPFPFETLAVNLIGCFFLTYFVSHPVLSSKLYRPIQVGLGTGLIGSFTTFSTFSTETIDLWMNQEQLLSFLYVLVSILGGLLLSWTGYRAGQKGGHST
ncbi:fluoride efflux transporter CrcB [Pontibacillus sp. HMF3514]|uniref:fluoride efflux transporter CrcB n=1 Tax=Pontibacillus sp. HMF3514 TaxID=2692425 RepID=UPI00131F65A4|nr:fluoride efflux transporter CrcB [Pontibacillus sp. HMF3514]QHE53468.1 fluoride efflux transporter CrcB [Pontibacillus sp. HMF3514]